MTAIGFDTDLFPLVQVVNRGGSDDQDYRALFDRFDELLLRRERFVVLSDTLGDAFPNATQRKIIADWFPKAEKDMNRYSLGCAMVLRNSLQRGAITALNWIMRPDVPMAAFDDRGPALAWCRNRLVTSRVDVPPHVDRALRGAA